MHNSSRLNGVILALASVTTAWFLITTVSGDLGSTLFTAIDSMIQAAAALFHR